MSLRRRRKKSAATAGFAVFGLEIDRTRTWPERVRLTRQVGFEELEAGREGLDEGRLGNKRKPRVPSDPKKNPGVVLNL